MGGWKVESLGISSKDFQGDKEVRNNYGSKWRFANDPAMSKTASEPTKGLDQGQGHEHEGDEPKGLYTADELSIMKKDDLISLASSLGVADLGGTKAELSALILEKQG